MRQYPTIVMLHGPEHGDFEQVRLAAGLQAPLSVRSFTDTYPETNKYNEAGDALRRAVYHDSDFLFIQEGLLHPVTDAARLAVNTSLLSSAVRSRFGVFDEEYSFREVDVDEMFERVNDINGLLKGE